ncbi:lysine -specific demethylase 4c-like protein [Colletotrichum musicola]|uniref:Lysine -specific demethylase 4c-like protein n=1 Tax=Colletotrichum musicola TaxID=2175873 RepID=A0A8H6IXD4_9PEZI|nr:lysine -specific demethylase 4c-like protein [Colletotrichum musicola]
MDVIVSKLRALETKLQQVDKIVSALRLSTPHAGTRTRSNNCRQMTTKPTSDLDELRGLLAGLSAELQQIRREGSQASEQPAKATSPADAASPSSALSSPPPSVASGQHLDPPTDHPAPPEQVADAPTAPRPRSDDSEARADPAPQTAADPKSTAALPLSNLGPDVEGVLQHAGSLFEAHGESPTDTTTPAKPTTNTTRPKFTLTVEEIGVNFVPNIAKMVIDKDFAGKVWITNLPEVN